MALPSLSPPLAPFHSSLGLNTPPQRRLPLGTCHVALLRPTRQFTPPGALCPGTHLPFACLCGVCLCPWECFVHCCSPRVWDRAWQRSAHNKHTWNGQINAWVLSLLVGKAAAQLGSESSVCPGNHTAFPRERSQSYSWPLSVTTSQTFREARSPPKSPFKEHSRPGPLHLAPPLPRRPPERVGLAPRAGALEYLSGKGLGQWPG